MLSFALVQAKVMPFWVLLRASEPAAAFFIGGLTTSGPSGEEKLQGGELVEIEGRGEAAAIYRS